MVLKAAIYPQVPIRAAVKFATLPSPCPGFVGTNAKTSYLILDPLEIAKLRFILELKGETLNYID